MEMDNSLKKLGHLFQVLPLSLGNIMGGWKLVTNLYDSVLSHR